MGFETGSLTKSKTVSLHRAACRALRANGRMDDLLDRDLWEEYLARVANVGSRTQAHNLNWRLQKLGLLQIEEGRGVRVLESDYSSIILDEA